MTQTDIFGNDLLADKNTEWYTPSHILEAVYHTLGTVDLDPCCNTIGDPNVKATKYYRIADDGLIQKWEGSVFLNPPYGESLTAAWVNKLIKSYAAADVTEAVLLIPARTDTQYWHNLAVYSPCWCAIKGRLSFLSPFKPTDNQTGRFSPAVVLLATNPNTCFRFWDAFSHFGKIYVEYNQ